MPVIQLLGRLRQENCLNQDQGSRGCSQPRLHHCTQAWATEQDSISKKKKKKIYQSAELKVTGVRIRKTSSFQASSILIYLVVKGVAPTSNPWFQDLHALLVGETEPFTYWWIKAHIASRRTALQICRIFSLSWHCNWVFRNIFYCSIGSAVSRQLSIW